MANYVCMLDLSIFHEGIFAVLKALETLLGLVSSNVYSYMILLAFRLYI